MAKNQRRHQEIYTKYQQNKIQHMKKVGEFYLLEILEGSWQEISIDIIGLLS